MSFPSKTSSEFSAELDQAIASARSRVLLGTVLTLASVGLVGYYLNYAHEKFAAVDPGFVADYATAEAINRLPSVADDVKEKLIAAAPGLVDSAEARLKALPAKFTADVKARAESEVSKLAPTLEADLTAALTTALEQARASGTIGKGDEKGIKSFVDALADTYAGKASTLIDGVHAKYRTAGGDALAYLEFLAEGKNLDPHQTLQRQALVGFLTTAARTKTATLDAN